MSDNKELIAQLKYRAETAEEELRLLMEEKEEKKEKKKKKKRELEIMPLHVGELLATTLRFYQITDDREPDCCGNPIETDYALLNMIISIYDLNAGILLDIMRLCAIRQSEYAEEYNSELKESELYKVVEIYNRLKYNLPELREEAKKRLYKCWESRPAPI